MIQLAPQITDALGEIEHRAIVADDGVELAVQCFGPPSAPAVVLANGIGVRYWAFAHQIADLRPRYRAICWDYRGIGESPQPFGGDLSFPRHARDIVCVLDALSLERAVVLGWSMGVQVGLELLRAAPERVAGFVALLGSFGIPLRTAFPTPVAAVLESLVGRLAGASWLPQAALDAAVALPQVAFGLLSTLQFVGPDVDRVVFEAAVRSVATVDKRVYMRQMLELADHDASDMLSTIRCPTLVIAGTRDRVTPPRVAQQLARSVPDALYHEVTGGSHFALMEQPRPINGWLHQHLGEVYG